MDIFHEIIHKDYSIAKENYYGFLHHWHQRFEFVYIIEGEYEFTIAKNQYLGKKGDLFAIHSGEIHCFSPKDATSMSFVCTFNPSILYHLHADISFVESYIPAQALQSAGIQEEIHKIFEEIHQENSGNEKWNDIFIQTDIIRLYSMLVRYFEKERPDIQKDFSTFKNFQTALSYIAERYAENITLKDVAAQISYHPSYVSTMFVTYTGVNFKRYLDNIRINHAVRLIQSTEQTFTEIATQCGYENIRTFNDAFKRITGIAPSQLRNKNI